MIKHTTNIKFPTNSRQRYYNTHYRYVLEMFRHLNYQISFFRYEDKDKCVFPTYLNGKKVWFDFADSAKLTLPNDYNDEKIFKFHNQDNLRSLSFSPISFYNWNEYYNLLKDINYNPVNDVVSNRQRAYGNATQRRNLVNRMLNKSFKTVGNNLLQLDFWKDINNISLSVCIPGQRIDILDRGQLQYMAFGCCTISTKLNISLINDKLVPNIHYIQCKDDFSDLVPIIKSLFSKKEHMKEIGNNCKKLFENNFTPKVTELWIMNNI